MPPACSSAAPGTCVKQAEKSASIKEASYKVSYSAELSPSSSSAASVPTAACRIRSSPGSARKPIENEGSETAACRTVRRRKTPGSSCKNGSRRTLAEDASGVQARASSATRSASTSPITMSAMLSGR